MKMFISKQCKRRRGQLCKSPLSSARNLSIKWWTVIWMIHCSNDVPLASPITSSFSFKVKRCDEWSHQTLKKHFNQWNDVATFIRVPSIIEFIRKCARGARTSADAFVSEDVKWRPTRWLWVSSEIENELKMFGNNWNRQIIEVKGWRFFYL